MCHHVTPCPDATSEARDLAAVVSSHPEQGWSLLCNGVVLFDDDGELLPDGRAVARPPHLAGPELAGAEDPCSPLELAASLRTGLAGGLRALLEPVAVALPPGPVDARRQVVVVRAQARRRRRSSSRTMSA